ncbi:alanine racemase [Streptomyces sp. NPDC018019]|uniref:alanine racemase n=1 Tax=Streptomyces sp. NPDC018019 TaxID=3365030 RepID=UPI0037B5E3FB
MPVPEYAPARLPGDPLARLDIDVLERNIARMAAAARSGGFALRPHAKTHKCPQIAARQLAMGASGLTVATIREAEAFADAGVTDLFIACPLWPDADKARRLRRLAEVTALRVGVESAGGARHLGRSLRGAARPVEVLVEIDSGHHRTGAGLDVVGVFTFPGHGYGHDAHARERAARDEESALAQAASSWTPAARSSPPTSRPG